MVPGARLYPLVPPLPVLSSLKPDHLLSAVVPAYALRADGGRTAPVGRERQGAAPRTTESSRPRSSETVTLDSVGSAWRAAEYAPSVSTCERTLSATTSASRLEQRPREREQRLVVVLLRVEEDEVEGVLRRARASRARRPRPARPTPRGRRPRRSSRQAAHLTGSSSNETTCPPSTRAPAASQIVE